ncbi:MAG: hypothetical protein HQL95_05250 [Magnetococcales bacterium]|nr:hypothetical protein [Magnetococcales bacterium]
MAIASDAIASVPICGSMADRIGIEFLAEWADAAERLVIALEQTYGLRLDIEHGQRYGNTLVQRQSEQSYGAARTVVGHEQCWESNAIIKAALVSPYGTQYPILWLSFPYGDAPVQAQNEQPIGFTLDAVLSQEWSLMAVVQAQCAQTWTSTTSVFSQGAFPYDILVHDPVVASLIQIWNLSDDRAIRLSGTVVRAFHLGELV